MEVKLKRLCVLVFDCRVLYNKTGTWGESLKLLLLKGCAYCHHEGQYHTKTNWPCGCSTLEPGPPHPHFIVPNERGSSILARANPKDMQRATRHAESKIKADTSEHLLTSEDKGGCP